ncbi:hypothetical protein OS493_029454 [Desmophyllum pertusum]|uniref:receptor protein-tyrosine kinase n=1 Tax=Desmophyllum pertusum TaxID=174260 RepID=A0A9X0CIY2_9CNID|nr:hypothetical protein OS493_029454 [Desmophyllum pertusum]
MQRIAFYPQEWSGGYICMRLELYGCVKVIPATTSMENVSPSPSPSLAYPAGGTSSVPSLIPSVDVILPPSPSMSTTVDNLIPHTVSSTLAGEVSPTTFVQATASAAATAGQTSTSPDVDTDGKTFGGLAIAGFVILAIVVVLVTAVAIYFKFRNPEINRIAPGERTKTLNINSTAFVNVNESKSVVINCTFESGTPTWTRQDGGEVETTTRKIKNGVLLEIKKASIADTGVYVCTNGGNTHKITVQVLVEVKVEMALVVLNYGNFTEELEDNTTPVYKATEKNFTTEMDKVHKGHTPGYVKTIVLKFSEGSVKVDFQIVIILVTNNPKNATTIADKKAEAAQRVVVRAKKGAVERLRVKAVIVKTDPLEPENVEIFGIDSDELSVRWQPSEDADAFEVSEYLVQHRAFSEKVYTNFTQRSSKDKTQYSYRVKPLEPETTYMVRVAAINKYGHNFNEESSHQTDPAPFAWWIILVVVLIILFVLGLLVGVILYRRKRARERELAREEEPRFNALQREARSNAVALYEDKNVKGLTLSFTNDAYKPSELNWEEIPYENLKLLNELGSGAFGIVYKGELLQDNGNVTACAVKALKPSATNEEIRDLYNELEIMTNVGHHPNLVNLIGACTEDGHLLVVLEIAENGSLLEFLKSLDKLIKALRTSTAG